MKLKQRFKELWQHIRFDLWQRMRFGRDSCKFCLGYKNGMPGNENLCKTKDGELLPVCDYCSYLLWKIE